MGSVCHVASTLCTAPAVSAFRYVADVGNVGSWTLGSWGAEMVGEGLARGTSLFDGSVCFIRTEPDEQRLMIDFLVGDNPDELVMRISVRIVPGSILGHDVGSSILTMLAWRPEAMEENRWAQLCASHDVEIHLLRRMIELDGGAG